MRIISDEDSEGWVIEFNDRLWYVLPRSDQFALGVTWDENGLHFLFPWLSIGMLWREK